MMINEQRLEKIRKNLVKEYDSFEFLGEGRRGRVYKLSDEFVVKVERDDISAFNTLKNACKKLKRLEEYEYFTRVVEYDEELRYLIREYVNGRKIREVELSEGLITECLRMCRVLDEEKINQTELTNASEHVFVHDGSVMMIDFERARLSEEPSNVSQFTQYLMKRLNFTSEERENLIPLVKDYKENYNEESFQRIISFSYRI